MYVFLWTNPRRLQLNQCIRHSSNFNVNCDFTMNDLCCLQRADTAMDPEITSGLNISSQAYENVILAPNAHLVDKYTF